MNSLVESARPGQTMILWGTGLGAVRGDEGSGPLPGDLPVDVEVLVANRRTKVLYKGRSGCCAGIDQIVFEVPLGVEGCYLPVAVRTGNVLGNFGTLSVSPRGGICSDPHGYSQSDIEGLLKRREVRLGRISLTRVDAKITASTGTTSSFIVDSGSATFSRYSLEQALGAGGTTGGSTGTIPVFPLAYGSCVVYLFRGFEVAISDTIRPDPLDAGVSLDVRGPGVSSRLLRKVFGLYSADLGASLPGLPGGSNPPFLSPGAYSLNNGPGGRDVSSFGTGLTVDSSFSWLNRDDVSSVRRSQSLILTWGGVDDYKDYVAIMGASISPIGVGGAFVCMERAGAGGFIVPATVLATLPMSGQSEGVPTAVLQVARIRKSGESRFAAPGLDIATVDYAPISAKYLPYQ